MLSSGSLSKSVVKSRVFSSSADENISSTSCNASRECMVRSGDVHEVMVRVNSIVLRSSPFIVRPSRKVVSPASHSNSSIDELRSEFSFSIADLISAATAAVSVSGAIEAAWLGCAHRCDAERTNDKELELQRLVRLERRCSSAPLEVPSGRSGCLPVLAPAATVAVEVGASGAAD